MKASGTAPCRQVKVNQNTAFTRVGSRQPKDNILDRDVSMQGTFLEQTAVTCNRTRMRLNEVLKSRPDWERLTCNGVAKSAQKLLGRLETYDWTTVAFHDNTSCDAILKIERFI